MPTPVQPDWVDHLAIAAALLLIIKLVYDQYF